MKNLRRSAAAVGLAAVLAIGAAAPASAHGMGRTWTAWDGMYRITYKVGAYVNAGPKGPCDTHSVSRYVTFAPPWDWRSTLPNVNMTVC